MTEKNSIPGTNNYFISISIIGVLFFIFGFVTWLNGSLIPFLKIACELNQTEAYLVTFAFYISYTIMAIPMSAVLQRTGYKNGMVVGLIAMSAGSLIFIPAAETRIYLLFLAGLFIMGGGLTILQTASNPYIVNIGPKESAAVRISFMGLANKFAGILSPLLFTALILHSMEKFSDENLKVMSDVQKAASFNELASRLILPYIIMAAILLLLAAMIKFSPLPEIETNDEEENEADVKSSKTSILQFPQLVLGAIALFFYVGVEVIAGDSVGMYGKNLGVPFFGKLTSYTMAFMVLGYIAGIATIPRLISQEKALIISALTGFILSAGVLLSSTTEDSISKILFGWMGISVIPNSILFLTLLGFSNAMVWPAIWPIALDGLGNFTKIGSAILIMGIAGGALLPLLYGVLANFFSPQTSYLILLPCYLFIFYYAVHGHKKRKW